GVRHRLLAQDADVERIAVAAHPRLAGALRAAVADALAAIGLRQEAVERRRLAGVALRPIEPEVAARLVQLVLYAVGGDDLDEGVDDARRIARRDAVPGVGLEHGVEQGLQLGHGKLAARVRSAAAPSFNTGAPSPTSTASTSSCASRRTLSCSAGRSSI